MKFICQRYPFLTFYADNKEYKFYGGVFDLDACPEEERSAIRASLSRASADAGVMIEEEYSLPFRCEWGCDRKFASQAARNGHKPFHKTQADIDMQSWREGGGPARES